MIKIEKRFKLQLEAFKILKVGKIKILQHLPKLQRALRL